MRDATPRPWIVKQPEGMQVRHGNMPVCIMQYANGNFAEAEANAELIVRAVNSYDAMREALEFLINNLDGAEGLAPDVQQCLTDTKAALAQQEEPSHA